ncbi:Cell division protein SufI [Lactobacillus delbrueckii subsp. bulgaricus 2038]|nr:Cell division protein SufI [Lactobacillus delbrueckii subsp. bulgaricus 2038]
MTVYPDYFYAEKDFDTSHMGYKPLTIPAGVEAQPLAVPPLLAPDKVDANDIYYTIEAQEGESQILLGKKTETWGYNAPLLGQTLVVKTGQRVHVRLKNSLPVLTSFHWHGMEVPGPITDGGCHAPVYPWRRKRHRIYGQAASRSDLAARPPMSVNGQRPCRSGWAWPWGVWLLTTTKPACRFQRTTGLNEFPIILQDRTFHDNQLDYRADYDPMGVFGEVPLINGVIRPYVDVTTQKVRLLFLGGSNRREWRLHFENDLTMTQIGGDDSFLRHPIDVKKLLIGPGERQQVIVDFAGYKEGDVVSLYTDDFKLVEFRIHAFEKDDRELPFNIFTPDDPAVNSEVPVRHVTMDDNDKINGLRFSMERIDMKQTLNSVEYWDVTNTNNSASRMLHPFHIHGTHFLVVSRNGQKPNPNEINVYMDTIEVGPGETVRLKVYFQNAGVFMYHCHIIEHEDADMMAQIQIVDPKDPDKTYKLMDMETITNAFAEEMGVEPGEVFMPGMDVEDMDMGACFHAAEAETSRRLVEAVTAASRAGHEGHHDAASGASHHDATSGASHH